MKWSHTESKKLQITSWIRKISKSDVKVIVSDYSYHCFFTGNPITKTLIVFPDHIETKGVLAINKPLDEVQISDVIKLYGKIS